MSMIRLFRWTCDGCGAIEEREDYGLPRGWVFVKDRAITHRCPSCQQDIPSRQRGVPKVTADR